jgi:DNA-binding NarL/FixJ family response regulator
LHLVEGYEEFMPRVLIADDHPVVRRGILGILQSSPEWELCGQADNGRDAVRLTGELKPDVAILDVSMPGLNGVEAARIICEQFPATKVMLLTLHSSIELIRSAFRAGVRGYVLKSDAEQELLRALAIVIADGTYVSPKIDDGLVKEVMRETQKSA